MNFRTVLLELLTARPDLREDPFLLYDTVCTRLGDDPQGRREAKSFYEVDRRTSLSSFLSESTSQAELEDFCRENGVGENKTWGLLEALFGVTRPTLSDLDEDTLLHYASSNPLDKNPNENLLHIDFDCRKLRDSYVIFRQPLFELRENPIRPWKLCPHCLGATPMRFVHTKKHWWNACNIHLTVMSEEEKAKARRQRDS